MKPAPITIARAFRSKRLMGASFSGPSWDLWEAVIKAAYAEPLDDDQIAAFRQVAARNLPTRRVKEFVAVVGRGGGKDSVASALATHAAISFDPRGRLRPGEKAVVMCIACDRDQAGIVFDFIRAYFEEVPALAKMVVEGGIRSHSIELRNRVVVEVHSNSYRAVRGRSVLCCIFDEVALFRSDESANPDTELHAAIVPGLRRVKDSMMIMISSAYRRTGLLYQRFADYYGRDDEDTLVVRGTTMQFNPLSDAAAIAKDIESDPQRFNAEYNSEWRDDLSTFISRELLDAATDWGVTVRPPQKGIQYKAFVDPSGGRNDSHTCAIGHEENGKAILDCVIEVRSPHDPEHAVMFITDVLNSYGVYKVTGDSFTGDVFLSIYARHNITYEKSKRDRSKIYHDNLPMFTSGQCHLIEHQRMYGQYIGLECRAFPSGDVKVNHGKGGHDDVCNAVAGLLTLCLVASKSEVWANFNRNAPAALAPSNGIPASAILFAQEHARKFGNVF